MKIQALNLRIGDRIIVYFKNKMQICTVKNISTPEPTDITLSVFLGERYRYSSSGIIRFKSEALVDLIE
jgi:ribosome recycling factor